MLLGCVVSFLWSLSYLELQGPCKAAWCSAQTFCTLAVCVCVCVCVCSRRSQLLTTQAKLRATGAQGSSLLDHDLKILN